MNAIENILYLLERFNALIKFHIKAYREDVSDERKINIKFANHIDIELFRSEVQLILQQGEYSRDFVCLINRIYLLSESNSDLMIEGNQVIRGFSLELQKKYSFFSSLDTFSLKIFQFIHYDIWNARDEYDRPIQYKLFDSKFLFQSTEYLHKDDKDILWQTYYLLQDITKAYLIQEKQDVEHQLSFKSEQDKDKFIQQQKGRRAEEIINLSNGFCDKNLPFIYLQHNRGMTKDNLFYLLLSDSMNKMFAGEYIQYVEFDYSKYKKNFHWNFAVLSLDNYHELECLFGFNRLVRILVNTLFIKDFTTEETITPKTKSKPKENWEEGEKPKQEEKFKTKIKSEYILPIPILDLVYQEFNDDLWDDITLVEFLGMFTSEINRIDSFKLKLQQTTRFYYLLKRIWINSANKSLFNTEKEWITQFLQNYNLSYSTYTNQSIKSEGGLKHRNFMKSVDKILPKNEIE